MAFTVEQRLEWVKEELLTVIEWSYPLRAGIPDKRPVWRMCDEARLQLQRIVAELDRLEREAGLP